MQRNIEATVLIVGAGPVGLSLAMDLAWRGIDVLVAETRAPGEPPNVKCNHVAARTMEIFRRLGVARAVREAGLPADYPNDVAYRTSFLGTELTRIKIPCRAERYTSKDGPDTWWPTPEPPHRINQIYLEPILFAHAAAMNKVRILNRTEVTGFVQDEAGVSADARDLNREAGAAEQREQAQDLVRPRLHRRTHQAEADERRYRALGKRHVFLAGKAGNVFDSKVRHVRTPLAQVPNAGGAAAFPSPHFGSGFPIGPADPRE